VLEQRELRGMISLMPYVFNAAPLATDDLHRGIPAPSHVPYITQHTSLARLARSPYVVYWPEANGAFAS